MTSYHKTIVTGHIGSIELRYTPEAKAVATFSVAVNDGWGDNKKTIWYRVTAWEKRAENCNAYLKKGSRVLVEGRLQPDPDTGGPRVYKKKDGRHGAAFELTADNVVFMDSKGEGHKAAESFADEAGGYMEESELPF